ncbi:MAG: AraC family transcriptional regulator [Burkholderiales bacterium]|nr:AraC family transcriptional regulator [Burkholderiales bacterium]
MASHSTPPPHPRTGPGPRAGSGTAVTPIAFIQAMALALRRGGIPATEALARAQIAPALLRKPGARVSAAQMEAFSACAMQALDDEALGWFSRRLPWGSYGMLLRASISSPDLGIALQRWCRHHGLLTDDVQLSLQRHGPTAQLRITERRVPGELRELCLVTLLRNLHGVACWLVDSRIPLEPVMFPFGAPPHADAYPHMFPGPVQFGAAEAGFDFDARYLALPLRRDERALQHLLKRALPLTVLPYRRDRLQVRRVRQLLRAEPAAPHSADAVAARLHVSVRTLHRQLAEEDSSLQALKDEARREHALTLLHRSERPIKQVALAVGFASEKSFARAFKAWTGQTPSQAREQAIEQTPGDGRPRQGLSSWPGGPSA